MITWRAANCCSYVCYTKMYVSERPRKKGFRLENVRENERMSRLNVYTCMLHCQMRFFCVLRLAEYERWLKLQCVRLFGEKAKTCMMSEMPNVWACYSKVWKMCTLLFRTLDIETDVAMSETVSLKLKLYLTLKSLCVRSSGFSNAN